MKRLGSFVASISVLLGLVIGAHPALAAPVDELVAAAKKEDVLELLAPSSLTPLGAQALPVGAHLLAGHLLLPVGVRHAAPGYM